MFKHLILPWLLPIFGMFFAAGADAVAGVDGDTGGSFDGSSGTEGTTGGEPGGESEIQSGDGEQIESRPAQQSTEEPEVQEFKGAVSQRLVGLTRQAPELKQVFQKYPKIQQQIEATFRREAALREVFPTVAEARQMREEFPNGLADVQQLRSDIKDVEELDNDFYTQDRDGNYPGHAKILDNMFRDDRNAAIALFRGLPKEWARLDRDSYNEVMGRVVGATIANAGIVEFISELAEEAGDHKNLKAGLTKLFNWAQGYLADKPKPTAEEERLSRDRASFDRQRAERDQEDTKRFDQTFGSSNRKIEQDAIKAHPAVQKLLANKTVTDQKKADILAQVHRSINELLKKSPAFMRKLTAAYNARNLGEASAVVKAAWSQQWLLNRMVRTVFSKEIPQMVSNNREAVRRRTGTTQQTRQTSDSGETPPKGPKQIGGRWYRDGGTGAPYTTAEVLAGKHLQP